jgi:heme-degrading monooxygenase HmoA
MHIARIWKGAVPAARADEYVEYMKETGLRDIRATAGNAGVLLLRREDGDVTRFATLSLWESFEAIRAFSGVDGDAARLEPRDAEFLVEDASVVEHYEVAFDGFPAADTSPISPV